MPNPSFLTDFVVPVSVMVSATATTATAGIAFQLYKTLMRHERALFGEEYDEDNAIVNLTRENQQRAKDTAQQEAKTTKIVEQNNEQAEKNRDLIAENAAYIVENSVVSENNKKALEDEGIR